jgi:hypothetical protein
MQSPIPFFSIKELVPQKLYEHFQSSQHILWGMFNEQALQTLVALRQHFGPLTVNDWAWGGGYQYSGFRPFDCTVGADLSQHRLGTAFDCKFKNVTAEEVRQYIKDNPFEFPYITHIEGDVDWFHFDCRFVPNWDGIPITFYPKAA